MKKVFVCLLLVALNGCLFGELPPSAAKNAESFHQGGKLDEAIAAYRQHIQDRLSDERRLPDENPQFYLLLIGDLYLEKGEPLNAEREYQKALAEKVEAKFLVSRFRDLALAYEKLGNVEDGMRVLRENRKLDPLLYDGTLDEMHKRLIAKEDAAQAK